MVSSKTSSLADVEKLKNVGVGVQPASAEDPDSDFGGREERVKLEKGLLRKLDVRMSILIVIYILNYVSGMILGLTLFDLTLLRRWIEITLGSSSVSYTVAFGMLTGLNLSSAARMRGFESDLRLQGTEFATLLSILYVGYILMQIPS